MPTEREALIEERKALLEKLRRNQEKIEELERQRLAELMRLGL